MDENLGILIDGLKALVKTMDKIKDNTKEVRKTLPTAQFGALTYLAFGVITAAQQLVEINQTLQSGTLNNNEGE